MPFTAWAHEGSANKKEEVHESGWLRGCFAHKVKDLELCVVACFVRHDSEWSEQTRLHDNNNTSAN